MDVKPGYKKSEVGVIPEEWDAKSFAELFVFRNGVNAEKDCYGKGVRFINVLEPISYSHLYGPEIPGKVMLPESVVASYAIRRGDVLFNRTSETDAELGLAATYLGTERVVFGGFVIRGRPTDGRLDPTYSGYALRAPAIRSQIIPMGQGAIRANIGQQNLSRVVAPVPPLTEQRVIAEALSDVDALRRRLDQLIDKKRDLKQAAMQQLLTGRARLPGFHGEWEFIKVGDIGRFRGGNGFPTTFQGKIANDYPFYKVSDMNNEGNDTFMLDSNNWISEGTRKQLGATAFPAGSIIFAKVGAAVFLERKKILTKPSCIDNNLAALVLDKSRTHVRFIHYSLLNIKFGSFVSTTALPSLSGTVLSQIPFALPPLPEQTAIAEVLMDLDAELMALEQRREKTDALKQAMMQQLLTGNIRLT